MEKKDTKKKSVIASYRQDQPTQDVGFRILYYITMNYNIHINRDSITSESTFIMSVTF